MGTRVTNASQLANTRAAVANHALATIALGGTAPLHPRPLLSPSTTLIVAVRRPTASSSPTTSSDKTENKSLSSHNRVAVSQERALQWRLGRYCGEVHNVMVRGKIAIQENSFKENIT